jgi:hypothetical protein
VKALMCDFLSEGNIITRVTNQGGGVMATRVPTCNDEG